MTDLAATVPDFVAKRAAELGCYVDIIDPEDYPPDESYGPFMLCDRGSGAAIWMSPLPLAGVIEALDCLGRELRGDKRAWARFGRFFRLDAPERAAIVARWTQ